MTDKKRNECLERIKRDQAWLLTMITKAQETFDWVCANIDKLVELGVSTSAIGGQVYLLFPDGADNRETVLAIIKAFPGKWNKSAGQSTMTYSLPEDNERPRLCFNTHSLPPSCRVEEVTITTPAQPATTRTEMRVVCKTGKEDEL